jgi:S1-C subfamily serine protease
LPKDYGALIIKGQTQNDLAVIPGSPADKAGLTENDIILEVDGTKIDDKHSLAFLLSKYEIGDTVNLKVYTKGNEKEVKVKLEESK